MSVARLAEVARVEVLRGLRRPMLWVWLGILTLMTWGLSGGGLQIQSGDATTGGQKAWLTSEYARKWTGIADAESVLEEAYREIAVFTKHSRYYSYAFFVMRA